MQKHNAKQNPLPSGMGSIKDIAVIGTGYWGKNLVRNFNELGRLHSICDVDYVSLSNAHRGIENIRVTSDYRLLLGDAAVKGVVIATPAETHYALAKEALMKGKDVFIEKPLALRLQDGRELVKLAEGSGRVLLVGHVLEYHLAIQRLKEMIDGGDLGDVRYIYSNRLNLGKFRTEENILWSFAPHDISVILLLTGMMPDRVIAQGGYFINEGVADVTVTCLEFPRGVRAHIFVSWLHPYKEQRLVVVGERAMVVFDDLAQDKLVLYKHGVRWDGRLPVPDKGDMVSISVAEHEPLKLECMDFIHCMETRDRPRVDGRKGVQVLNVLEMCQEALKEVNNV